LNWFYSFFFESEIDDETDDRTTESLKNLSQFNEILHSEVKSYKTHNYGQIIDVKLKPSNYAQVSASIGIFCFFVEELRAWQTDYPGIRFSQLRNSIDYPGKRAKTQTRI